MADLSGFGNGELPRDLELTEISIYLDRGYRDGACSFSGFNNNTEVRVTDVLLTPEELNVLHAMGNWLAQRIRGRAVNYEFRTIHNLGP